jgi:lysophospholipase L1-like esterase
MQNPNDVHFNAKGCDFLGQTVAASIEAVLKHKRASGSSERY